MAFSKIYLVGNSIFGPHNPFFRIPSNRFSRVSLRLRCFCIAAAAADASPPPHPWTEWMTFVDNLKTKGYFSGEPPNTENGGSEMIYREMNLVKDACLSFARDRYDLLKLLPSRDIEALVERGCPNLLRKAVNSSKRLRAHARLDEGDVCGTCSLRGSCDRAYITLKDSEANARTVDIMRILLFNALDSLVISRGERPPDKELVDESSKKLLLELVELSQNSPDPPALPKPATKGSLSRRDRGLKLKTEKSLNKWSFVDFSGNENCQDSNETPNKSSGAFEVKKGDWYCPKCNFLNFAKNSICRECSEVPDKLSVVADVKEGDWICTKCNFLNFSRNRLCLKCKADGPEKISTRNTEMKKGDWNCSGCGFMNFASNKQCLRCPVQRPNSELYHGEWNCPSCDFLNFSRNNECKKCDHKRPKQATTGAGSKAGE
ncbi:PREDICTED: zinc finger protein VAR3, chloroplastic-like [Tarenaya hassleriana]|uniref:zinc finger protein VAR3, chloroplastic-like n=1 Tax=Tarenaya hassleriana TaxID=28532 RepID=UPI00053C19AF|nr:PREDICTED: zinc finger protein VAR3, chloroplastic-like [Tarenaya hassleriana]